VLGHVDGARFFQSVQRELGRLPLIAEDLGIITPEVVSLRDQFQLPGMRVLQFAFDGRAGTARKRHQYSSSLHGHPSLLSRLHHYKTFSTSVLTLG